MWSVIFFKNDSRGRRTEKKGGSRYTVKERFEPAGLLSRYGKFRVCSHVTKVNFGRPSASGKRKAYMYTYIYMKVSTREISPLCTLERATDPFYNSATRPRATLAPINPTRRTFLNNYWPMEAILCLPPLPCLIFE